MGIDQLIIFAGASLVLAMTPGPDTILLVSRSLTQGKRAAYASLLGITGGLSIHAGLVATGLSGLLLYMPLLYDFVRYAGALYLFYLAWQSFFAPPRTESGGGLLPLSGFWPFWRQGFLTNLLNPKVALFYLALFPQFIQQDGWPIFLQIGLLHLIFLTIGCSWNSLVIFAAGWMGKHLAAHSLSRRFGNWLLGTVFAALAMRLVFAPR